MYLACSVVEMKKHYLARSVVETKRCYWIYSVAEMQRHYWACSAVEKWRCYWACSVVEKWRCYWAQVESTGKERVAVHSVVQLGLPYPLDWVTASENGHLVSRSERWRVWSPK